MDALWAPWRMEFILADKEDECIFCTKPKDDDRLRENLILARGEHSYVILNKYPYNNGHLMVVPFKHTVELAEITPEEALEMHGFLQKSVEVLRGQLNPQGFNMGLILGRAAGAGIEDHLHYHVVPRWSGDTNFMPVLAEAKSMPEHLLASFDRLHPHFS